MNELFHSAPVAAEWWLWTTAIGVLVFVLVEADEAVRRRAARSPARPAPRHAAP
jgi:hypothetical protein